MHAVKPKIAIVVSHPIQHFCPMYESLAKQESWEIKLFFASKAGLANYFDKNFGKEIKWGGIRVDTYPHHFLNNGEVIKVSNELDAPDLNRALDEYNPDAVVIYGYAQKLQRRAFFWARKHKKKMFMISDAEIHTDRPPLKEMLKWLPLRWYLNHFHGFLTVGNANENYYYRYGVPTKKLFRTGFSIDVESFEEAYESRKEYKSEIYEKYDLTDDDFVCMVVGKLVPWKKQENLVDALLYLEEKGVYGVTAMIVGSGVEEEKIAAKVKKLKKNRVIMTGFIQPSDLPKLYATTDVYIHTSKHEPHSLAISEAIYMGKPLIISENCGSYGSMDDLQLGRNGFVYQAGDYKELGARIEQMLTQPQLVEEFGEFSRKFAVESQKRAHGGGLRAAMRANGFSV